VKYKGFESDYGIKVGKLELDTHADTCCLGYNFVPILYTGQVCDVQPFADGYAPMKDIPVVTGVTAYDDEETGLTYLLEFHQSLWFGEHMDYSLINLNQVRSTGISLCDDPYDKHRKLGVELSKFDKILPFAIQGNIVSMLTRTPTEYELANCERYVVMTSEDTWDPDENLDAKVVKSVQLYDPSEG
jgi:hypothetical protein